MSNTKEYDSILGIAHAVDILIFLDDVKKAVATDMRTVTSNYHTIVKVSRILEEAGLLEISITTSPRVTHTYILTAKGEKIAEKLKEIEQLLED